MRAHKFAGVSLQMLHKQLQFGKALQTNITEKLLLALVNVEIEMLEILNIVSQQIVDVQIVRIQQHIGGFHVPNIKLRLSQEDIRIVHTLC